MCEKEPCRGDTVAHLAVPTSLSFSASGDFFRLKISLFGENGNIGLDEINFSTKSNAEIRRKKNKELEMKA